MRGHVNHARQMMETNPNPTPVDAAALIECIEACFDCAQACTACANAWLGEQDILMLAREVRILLTALYRVVRDCALTAGRGSHHPSYRLCFSMLLCRVCLPFSSTP